MKIYKDLIQGTDEWLKIRLGKLTASKAKIIAVNGKGLETLVFDKVQEIVSKEIIPGYKNKAMEWGNEQEPKARIAYEFETGNPVTEVGFVELDEFVGCSPDGLVGDKGLVEIKSPTIRTFYEYMNTGKIDDGYMYQMQMQMYVTGREWCDYVVFNPYFKTPLIIKRVDRSEAHIAKLKVGLAQGIAQIKAILERIK